MPVLAFAYSILNKVVATSEFSSMKVLNTLKEISGNGCSFCTAFAPGHKNATTIKGLSN